MLSASQKATFTFLRPNSPRSRTIGRCPPVPVNRADGNDVILFPGLQEQLARVERNGVQRRTLISAEDVVRDAEPLGDKLLVLPRIRKYGWVGSEETNAANLDNATHPHAVVVPLQTAVLREDLDALSDFNLDHSTLSCLEFRVSYLECQ